MANLHSSTNWEELPLIKDISDPYKLALDRVRNHVAPLLQSRPFGAEEFTDHDLNHSTRVMERIGQILSPTTKLNQSELYILSLSALLHDSGLWTSKSEAIAVLATKDFEEFCREFDCDGLKRVKELLNFESTRWMGELTLQRLVATYHRTTHAERLSSSVLRAESEPGQTLRTLIGDEFVEAVELVSVAHSWDREQILSEDELRPRQYKGEVACLRFLAELLRLGDLLDLGEGRISTLLWSYLTPMAPVSESHWRKEATLRLELCSPKNIRVVGTFDPSRQGFAAAEAYRLAQDWLSMLDEEIHGVALVLNNRIEIEHRSRLQFGPMELDTKRVTTTGLELNGKTSFQLPRERIFELLSNELYSDRTVFVRELLQNSIDATRAQLIRDSRIDFLGEIAVLNESEPWNWPDSVTNNSRYEIQVRTSFESTKGRQYVRFKIADKGIGMSLNDISDYFLQVGKSYYTSNKYKQEFRHSSISRFGIGFLTCLSIADRIEVTTRQHNESAALCLCLQQPSEHFILTKDGQASIGTQVCLDIPLEKLTHILAHYFHVREEDKPLNEEAISRLITRLVELWVPYVEFPILVNNKRIEPNNPKEYVPLGLDEANSFGSVPVQINSPSGDEIAQGRIFYEFAMAPKLPVLRSVNPQVKYAVSCRGIRLVGSAEPSGTHQTPLVLDFRKLPVGSLSASRTIRNDWLFYSGIGDLVCDHFVKLVQGELKKLGVESSVVWQLFLDHRWGTRNLCAQFPVRTSTSFEWLSWEQICEVYDRLLLVPFSIAWKGPWRHFLPAVGVPDRQLGLLRGCDFPLGVIDDCLVMHLPDVCNCYLWPPNSKTDDLIMEPFVCTYTHVGLMKWQNPAVPRYLANGIIVDQRLVERELMNHDEVENCWEQLGVREHGMPKDGSLTGEYAFEFLNSLNSFTLVGKELVVTLDDTDDWC
jgi:hypothetical protein